MNDTDKLVAALFAATMTSRAEAPTPSDFFGFYDACIAEIMEREVREIAVKLEKKLDAQNKAWG